MDKKLTTNKIKVAGIISVLLLIAGGLFCPVALSNETPGLKLNLYTDQTDATYLLGEPIKIIMVIENITRWPINAPRDFSQIELHRSLVITDPAGEKHMLNMEEISPNMPPPFFWNDKETAPAEVLDADWARTVTIDDLGLLFGMITERPGIYTVEARQSFVMFPWTIQNEELGLMGIVDPQNPKYWEGTIPSQNVLKIIVTPAEGGQFSLRTVDHSLNAPTTQTPIRLYRNSDLQPDDTLENIWAKAVPYLAGTTDFQGWVAWDAGRPCIPRDEYLAIGYYQNEYKSALFEYDSQDWQAFCGSSLERRIFFKEEQHAFSVFGLNSVLIRNNARIQSGDVGAQLASSGPCLKPGFEVAFEEGTWVNDGLALKSDSAYIDSTASVWDVHANETAGGGTIRGEYKTPLKLPVWADLPVFPSSSSFKPSGSKKDDKTIAPHDTRLLSPDIKARDVMVGSHGRLELVEGVYHFRNLILGSHSRVICLGPVELRISETLESSSAKSAYLGPEVSSGSSAEDVVAFVRGEGDAVLLGQGVEIQANIFAKNGTLSTGEGCTLIGSFIARDVSIGQKSVVEYEGYFSRSDPEPPPNNVPAADFSYVVAERTVTFTDQSSDSDGSIVSWNWDFGDGVTSTDRNPVHTFAADGDYDVELIVTDDGGATDIATQNIAVFVAEPPPPEEEIVIQSVDRRKDKTTIYADISWIGATTATVIIHVNGFGSTITDNDGFESFNLGKNFKGQVEFQVCNSDGSICSIPVLKSF